MRRSLFYLFAFRFQIYGFLIVLILVWHSCILAQGEIEGKSNNLPVNFHGPHDSGVAE